MELSMTIAILAALVNAVFGTITAWVLVRDDFRGKNIVNAVIDLPFALPTIVAGLTLLTLYGPDSPIGLNVTYTRTAVVLLVISLTVLISLSLIQRWSSKHDR